MKGVALALVALLATAAPPSDSGTRYSGKADDDRVELTAVQGRAAERAAANIAPAERLTEFIRRPYCNPGDIIDTGADGVCLPFSGNMNSSAAPPSCGGDEPIPPLWRRDRATTTSPWSDWQNVVGWTCPGDYLPAFTAEDFRRLPLQPTPLTVQPARAEHLVNMPTIVYTTPATQLFTTDLLGYPVEVEATPTSYTWDFGDGTVLTTAGPGAPYPNHDVAHPYPRVGTWTITLTTEFTGRYRIAGTATWATVTGTAATTSSTTITTVEARSHLVTADCYADPTGPGC
jgi:hypothetical protein